MQDSNLPILSARTLEELIQQRVGQDRLLANLTGIFGALALLLAAIGIYGVVAYAVSQRTGEIGIRMALGADPWKVVGLIVKESSMIVTIGLAAGLALSYVGTRLIASKLFGLDAMDPAVLGAAVLVMAAIGALAACGPAWRASRIHPASALRSN